jgi:hypothetical protein
MLKPLHVLGLTLVILGAVNWGLVGLFQLDLIAALCGGSSAPASRVVYTVIGLFGLLLAATTIAVYSDWRAPSFPAAEANRPHSRSASSNSRSRRSASKTGGGNASASRSASS